MFKLSIGAGVALIAVGLVGFFATGAEHVTALIPAVLGVLLVLCGILAARPNLRMHAMHAAATLALLGMLGTGRGLVQLVGWMFGGDEPARPAAAVAQGITAIICLVFLIFAIRSFIAARRNRAAGA